MVSLFKVLSVMFFYYIIIVGKLLEIHGEGGASSSGGKGGTKIDRTYEPPVQESV